MIHDEYTAAYNAASTEHSDAYAYRPRMPKDPTPAQLRDHADALDEYEAGADARRAAIERRNDALHAVAQQFSDALRVEYGGDLTPEMGSKVFAAAWAQGHSYGFAEVESAYMELAALVTACLKMKP